MEKIRIIGFAVLLILTLTQVNAQEDHACPCCSEQHRQFDFWIGDWVTISNGDTAGYNRIVGLEDHCVVQENWKSATSNYSGTSYNYYDPQDGKWHQTWVDNQGQSLRLSGNRTANTMIMYSEVMPDREGNQVINRITWTANEDGTVRQHWENSHDGKSSWTTIFDGIYHQRNP